MQREIESPYNPDEIILIKSPKELKEKLSAIKADGPSKLSVITDFDDTMTKSNYKGERACNSFRVIENPKVIGPDAFRILDEARDKYWPLESDHSLTKEEKLKYMIEWRKLALDTFVNANLTKAKIVDAIKDSTLGFRFGMNRIIKTLIEGKRKLRIVSAGVGLVVKESLKMLSDQSGFKGDDAILYTMTPDIYDESGKLIKFTEPMIITGTKEAYITHELCKEISEGNNMILMGDLVEDSWVVKNLKLKNIIGIGFINMKDKYKEEQLKNIMDTYDIVVANDGNMIHTNEILRYLLGLELSSDYAKYEKPNLSELFH